MQELPPELTTAPDHEGAAAGALGSNGGDSRRILHDAVAGFRNHGRVVVSAVSPVVKTAPVGGPEQPDFLNQGLLVTTSFSPYGLLQLAQGLEQAAARVGHIR